MQPYLWQFFVMAFAGWVKLTDAIDGFLRDTRFLIHDRDPLFSASFRATLGAVGVETVKLPARSPNLNAYAERFVRSIKSECLSRMIPLGENHLRVSIRAFVAHYHLERNHQGLDNELICSAQETLPSDGRVRCRGAPRRNAPILLSRRGVSGL